MTLNAERLTGLYDRHAREILAFLARRTCDPEAAVDILAETFAAAFEDRDRFKGRDDGSARAWLYAIARHQLADYFRSERAHGRAIARLGVQRRELSETEYERIEALLSISQDTTRARVSRGLRALRAAVDAPEHPCESERTVHHA